MYTVTVEEVQKKLPEILEDVKRGIEVIIEQNNIKVAKLTPAPEAQKPETQEAARAKRRTPILGTAEGQVWMASDFDSTPEDFADYL